MTESIEAVLNKINLCWFFHDWKLITTKHFNEYYECSRCHKRKVKCHGISYTRIPTYETRGTINIFFDEMWVKHFVIL